MRERDIERRLVERVKQMGGEIRKVKWVGRDGAPDRVVMLPSAGGLVRCTRFVPARTLWVELKAPGKGATFPANAHERKQKREHNRMRKMGQQVFVIDSFEGVEELLK